VPTTSRSNASIGNGLGTNAMSQQQEIAHLHDCPADLVGCQFEADGCAEYLGVELEGLDAAVDDEGWGDPAVPVRNRLIASR
jgi:hypothetical protein